MNFVDTHFRAFDFQGYVISCESHFVNMHFGAYGTLPFLSYSRIRLKRIKQTSFPFIARERALLQVHGFEHLFWVRGDTQARKIAVH